MTTHENFLTNIENAVAVAGMPPRRPEVRNLISVPLFHVTGCNSQLLPTLQQRRRRRSIMPAFDVSAFLRAIAEERITVVTTVPAIFWYAINQPNFADVRLSAACGSRRYGGAPIAPELVQPDQAELPATPGSATASA